MVGGQHVVMHGKWLELLMGSVSAFPTPDSALPTPDSALPTPARLDLLNVRTLPKSALKANMLPRAHRQQRWLPTSTAAAF
jgi:hypothetical protein